MEQLPTPRLVDEQGQPLSPRIDDALRRLFRKFRKKYPFIRDETEVVEIFEKAGSHIALREAEQGPVTKLHGFAWVTLKNATVSWLRRGSVRMRLASIGGEDSSALLSITPAREGTPEQIENGVMLRESKEALNDDEWLVCHLKIQGYSAKEIGRQRGSSSAAANMVFSRAIRKLHRRKRNS
jgi:DNA-directed RNA polymerase specialized sigma24 family protein